MTVKIGTTTVGQGLTVGQQAFGAMSLTAGYYGATEPCPPSQAIQVVRTALQAGASLISTAVFYGANAGQHGGNEKLLGEAFKGQPRSSFVVCTKMFPGSADGLRKDVEESKQRLGVDFLDVVVLRCHNSPGKVLSEIAATLKELVQAGSIKYIGVSEMSIPDIETVHAIQPVSLCEMEWSLFARDAEEELVPFLRKNHIGILAYSPLGRGMLTGAFDADKLIEGDFRKGDDRADVYFGSNHREQNLKLAANIKELAAAKGITPGQLALAWVHAQGKDVIPLPGTKSEKYLLQNMAAADMKLTQADLEALEKAIPKGATQGHRYPGGQGTFNCDKQAVAAH